MTHPSPDEQKARPFSERLIAALKPLMADPDKTVAHIHEVAANMAIDRIGELEAALSEKTAEIERLKADRLEADNALVDKYREAKRGVFSFPEDVAAIVRRLEAAEARLSEVVAISRDDLMDAAMSLSRASAVITLAFGDDEIAARVFDALTHNGGPDNG